ncbi:MAG: ATP-dependent RecD-like helicase [Vampirovibrio sp.]|nr:ATP-dependent RecD-like helicase [Vampirovibrio sp.]
MSSTSIQPQLEALNGYIERVTYHNPDNGFCVLKVAVRNQKDLITVVGHNATALAGEHIEAIGSWFNDREHGLQFKAQTLRSIPPTTLEGMEKYLGSGLIKGIGPHYASRLIKAFGEAVFDVIEQEPQRLLKVDGIGQVRYKKIVQGWQDQKVVRQIMVFLQSHGIGTMRAVRIYKTYGEQAVDIVQENPYRLAHDIRGIGFKTADQLAQTLGIDAHSLIRAQAGVNYVLLSLSDDGHCAFPEQRLMDEASALLEIPPNIIQNAIQQEIREERLVSETVDGETWLYLKHLYRAEVELARQLRQLSAGEHPLPGIDAEKALSWVEQQTGLTLAKSQRDAIALATEAKVLVITGGPGVGKTTLVNSILKIFQAKKLNCLLCAPTGRAAKRLSESTGMEAKTVHRLLAFDPQTAQFTYNRENRLSCDVLVIDESSMMDLSLMNKLLQAVPDAAAVLLVGDVDQLPSVGPGNVLADVIESGSVPVVRLTEIFRQAAQSKIITSAHRINQGQMPDLKTPDTELSDFYFIEAQEPEQVHHLLMKLVRQRIPQRFNLRAIEDIQVLSPMNRSGLGARSLNIELQKALNPNWGSGVERFGSRFALGDKVMQTENNYDKDVFNGDIGIIRDINETDKELTISFEGRNVTYDFDELDELSLAYACTIHKSQGSEYPAVIVVLHTQHFQMLRRNLLYTGVTRGKRLVIIVGSKKALWLALKQSETGQRYSRLKYRLQQW